MSKIVSVNAETSYVTLCYIRIFAFYLFKRVHDSVKIKSNTLRLSLRLICYYVIETLHHHLSEVEELTYTDMHGDFS